jgi:hypothetical protein
VSLTGPAPLSRRILFLRAWCARRRLWGENLTVEVSFLLQFFFQAPPPKRAHLGFHLGFDLTQ